MRAVFASLSLALVFLGAPQASADEPVPVPTPAPTAEPATLQLRDGRVYHDVKMMAVEGESVVFNTREGLIKIPKTNLGPQTLASLQASPSAGPDLVMPSFNLNAAPVSPTPPGPAKPTPRPKATPAPKPTPNPVYKGCTIVGFTLKPFGTVLGTAEVVIHNDTDSPVVLYPYDITAVTASGALKRGHQFVVEQSFPPIIRRRETVQPHDSLQDQVTFTDEALELQGVHWTR